MNYYISGHSGFIGGVIAKYLLNKQQYVYAIPRDQSIQQLRTLFYSNKPDYIIHTSTYGNHYDQKNFIQMIEANITGTYNLLEAAKDFNYKMFYNFTTSSVFLKNKTYYSISKLCGEQLAGMYRNVVNIRPYSVYGPGEAAHRFVPKVISCLNSGKEMVLDEQATHAWIYIDDLVKAMFAGKTELGGCFISNKEVVEMLEYISGKKLKYIPGKLRDYDCSDVPAPGICYTSLYEGLRQTYEHYKTSPIHYPQFEER